MSKPTIDLVYFNAGGGHRAAAEALQQLCREQGRPWHVRLVNLFEVLDPKGRFRQLTGAAPEDFYNKRLARGWTLGMAQELKMLQGLIRLAHGSLVETLQKHWAATEPDLLVSLVPNFNRALCASVRAALPGVPFATVLTDMADLPPNFWIERDQRQHIVCGTPHALAQARAAGHRAQDLTLASGMVLRPSFYRARLVRADRAAAQRALGLDPAQPTGLVMFGGQGSAQMLKIAGALRDRQLILMCGHNAALAERLRAEHTGAPHAVLGFTREVAEHLQLADYFIGKPGPGCLSEALHLGLPVITTGGRAFTMPQERYNARWVRENGLGLVLPSMRGIEAAVEQMLARLPSYRAAVAKLDNRAVFEVVELFARLLDEAQATGSGSGSPADCASAGRASAGVHSRAL